MYEPENPFIETLISNAETGISAGIKSFRYRYLRFSTLDSGMMSVSASLPPGMKRYYINNVQSFCYDLYDCR